MRRLQPPLELQHEPAAEGKPVDELAELLVLGAVHIGVDRHDERGVLREEAQSRVERAPGVAAASAPAASQGKRERGQAEDHALGRTPHRARTLEDAGTGQATLGGERLPSSGCAMAWRGSSVGRAHD